MFIKHLQLVFIHCCKIFGGKLHVRRQLVLCQTCLHANPNGGWNTARCERHCSWFFTQEVHCESTHVARNSHQFSKIMPIDKFFSNNLIRHFHGIFNRFYPGFNRILPVYPILTSLNYRVSHRSPGCFAAGQLPNFSQVALLQSTCNSSPRSGRFFWKSDTFFFENRMKKGGIIYIVYLMNMNEIILMGYEWDIMGH